MKLFSKIVLAVSALTALTSNASVRFDYVLAKSVDVSDVQYTANGASAIVNVKFWVQPCAGQKFKQFVVADLSNEKGVRKIKVAVVIADSGLQCMGPTIQMAEPLVLQGPFEVPADISILK